MEKEREREGGGEEMSVKVERKEGVRIVGVRREKGIGKKWKEN